MDRHPADIFTPADTERARLAAEGLYRPDLESDACGVGLVAAIDGKPSRRVVEAGIEALKAVWHRGAVDADGKTGDGAGIHIDLPVPFFLDAIDRAGQAPRPNLLAVGMVFMPRTDLAAQESCRTIVESEIIAEGHFIYGWRQVPVDVSVIGTKAAALRPDIEQIMIAGPADTSEEAREAFEKQLYILRRRIEKKVIEAQIQGFYICSLSCRSIIYKGLFLAESLSVFYPDLLDPRFESRFAIYHQRYSTNTFPQWWLAQPFRCLAHNGEINTIRGNTNWMKSHEIKMAATAFGDSSEDIKPLIPAGSSDTAALDAVFEAIVRSGRDVRLFRLGHGALGRPGCARHDRRPLGRRRHGPQRAPPHALHPDLRWPSRRRLGNRHGLPPRGSCGRQGQAWARADDRRRPRRGPPLPRPRAEGPHRRRPALCRLGGRFHHACRPAACR
jgi:glutamate synthase (NADPH/NADH) large chain